MAHASPLKKSVGVVVAVWFVTANLLGGWHVLQKLLSGASLNNHDHYQLIFAFGVGSVALALWPAVRKRLQALGGVSTAAIYLLLASVEVLAGLFAGSWTLESRGGLAAGFLHGLLGTGGWAVGVLLAMRLFRFALFEICVLSGIAGWLVEGVYFQALYTSTSPALFLLLRSEVIV